MLDRKAIASLIVQKLTDNKEALKSHFFNTKNEIGFFYIDELLPEKLVKDIYKNWIIIKSLIISTTKISISISSL